MRFLAFGLCIVFTLVAAVFLPTGNGYVWAAFLLFGALTLVGIADLIQVKRSLRRNYPILANIRFLLEEIRPEIRQYFLESDTDGTPFNRSKRALVYQRAKHQLETRPFGTQLDVYGENFEWMTHSIAPHHLDDHDFRVTIGGPLCQRPYSASILNISAMSFGALSANAITALNKGARQGGFAHDTGEGGISIYHRNGGGDLIWEIGSGYFGCRNLDGTFNAEEFAQHSVDPQIKMIEIKLSQGAKPGHGGVLPASKVSAEIAAARGVPQGKDCISPARHSAFSTPLEFVAFIAKLRELSGGKPVGFKMCIGHPIEFVAILKAMIETGQFADFIVIDGAEGGTGAAPLEFLDHLGTPLREGLSFAHNCLVGAGLRKHIRLGAGGRIVTAFDIARTLALGADWCNSARGFMFSLGCIQSLACHTDRCPSGVATQNPSLQRGLVVEDKIERVAGFHLRTMKALAELTGAAGLEHPGEITPFHIMRRISDTQVKSFAEVYPGLMDGELLNGGGGSLAALWAAASAQSFGPIRASHIAAE